MNFDIFLQFLDPQFVFLFLFESWFIILPFHELGHILIYSYYGILKDVKFNWRYFGVIVRSNGKGTIKQTICAALVGILLGCIIGYVIGGWIMFFAASILSVVDIHTVIMLILIYRKHGNVLVTDKLRY